MFYSGSLLGIVQSLFPFNYGITGRGSTAGNRVLQTHLPFEVHKWSSGDEINGWLIPNELVVNAFTIAAGKDVILDGNATPLHVPANAPSYIGNVSGSELKAHLLSDRRRPNAIPWAWQGPYRPDDENTWQIAASQNFVDSITGRTYAVEIDTHFAPSTMEVLEYTLPGDTDETILLNAHNCHPFQANDDISGVAVGIAIMKLLAREPSRRLTYTLLVAPEIHGPVFWLQNNAFSGRISGSIMLKSLGNPAPLKLQDAFNPQSAINIAAHYAFTERFAEYVTGPFRAIYGNDETVFEAPPYRIPSISLTRWPFPEYHTDLDQPSRLSEEHLQEAVGVVYRICEFLEMGGRIYPRGRGLQSLSRHGLYRPLPMTEDFTSANYKSTEGRWHRLMNTLPSFFGDHFDLLAISQEFDLPPEEVHRYVMCWIEAGLASRERGQ